MTGAVPCDQRAVCHSRFRFWFDQAAGPIIVDDSPTTSARRTVIAADHTASQQRSGKRMNIVSAVGPRAFFIGPASHAQPTISGSVSGTAWFGSNHSSLKTIRFVLHTRLADGHDGVRHGVFSAAGCWSMEVSCGMLFLMHQQKCSISSVYPRLTFSSPESAARRRLGPCQRGQKDRTAAGRCLDAELLTGTSSPCCRRLPCRHHGRSFSHHRSAAAVDRFAVRFHTVGVDRRIGDDDDVILVFGVRAGEFERHIRDRRSRGDRSACPSTRRPSRMVFPPP